MVKPHDSNFKIIKAICSGVQISQIFMVCFNLDLYTGGFVLFRQQSKSFSKGPLDRNPYEPSVPFLGHRQTVQTQIRRRGTRRLIRVFTVCL